MYTDNSEPFNSLDVSSFHHHRINHSQFFTKCDNHINGIENFWNQAKGHLRKFNSIKQDHFYWFLKECDWRFDDGKHAELLKQLQYWNKKVKY